MKTKLCYLTESGWWDTDYTMLPYLKDYFDIEVYLVAERNKDKFNLEEVNYLRSLGIKVCIWRRKGRIRNISNLLLFIRLFFTIRKSSNKDTRLYYVYMFDPYINFIFIIFGFFLKKIVAIHDYENHEGMDGFLRNKLKSIILNSNSIFHFYSPLEYDKFKKEHPIKVGFYSEMPLKGYGQPTSSTHLFKGDEKKIRLLFFGYIRSYKGLDILLKALHGVDSSLYELTIAGEADNWDFYKEYLYENLSLNLHLGFVSNDQIKEYFSNADFLVLPYKDATQSGPLLVAINYNLPVIASNLECFQHHILDGIDGFIFEKNNSNDLRTTLLKVFDLNDTEYKEIKENQSKRRRRYLEKEQIIGETFFKSVM
ncbi:glycosyltransferase [Arcicella lustrica]|uniref:Glycosyltransferase n=1 Tax=Arcicella lustrica TaxID=2984196 RepID=A0ABU5SMT4_9BACT|nr:glycosyltransferase [Arcicella sp. DC25W]MEA5428586.1 glycosyltransferase [Arcicella sp. DC25W]